MSMEKLTLTNAKQCGNKSGIYHIVIEGTNHHYVGSAINLKKRLNAHRTALSRKTHRNPKMQNCFNKYGIDKFCFEILEFCEIKILLERESYYTKKLKPDLNIVLDPVELNRGEEFKQNLSASLRKYYKTHEASNKIKVYQYGLDGTFINEYNSATEAAIKVSGSISGIIAACNGRNKTHKKFQWRKYKNTGIESLIKIKPPKEKKIYIPKNRKIIYQYDLNGKYIKEWSHAGAASVALNIDGRSISLCANLNQPKYKSAGGYQWSYIKYNTLPKYENHSKDARNVPIYILDLIDVKELYFDKIADAGRYIKNENHQFDSVCAGISSSIRNGYIVSDRYLARNKNEKYKLQNWKVYININTKETYSNKKLIPKNAQVDKLINYARVKFRESEKNQEFNWSTLIEDL